MFASGSKIYKLIPGVQVLDEVFQVGYVVEQLNEAGILQSQFFSDLTKPKLLEYLKEVNGFKTHGAKLIEDLLEGIE